MSLDDSESKAATGYVMTSEERGSATRIRSILGDSTSLATGSLVFLAIVYFLGAVAVAVGLSLRSSLGRFLLVVGFGTALMCLWAFRSWRVELIESRKSAIAVGLVGLAIYVPGSLGVAFAPYVESGLLALAGVWIAGLGLVAISASASHITSDRPVRWTGLGLIVMIAALVLGIAAPAHDWVLVSAAMGAIAALSGVSQGLVSLARREPRLWSVVGLTVILSSGAMMLLLWLIGADLVLYLPGLLLIGTGLVPLSKGLPHLLTGSRRQQGITAGLLGLGVGAVLAVAFSRADWPVQLALSVIFLSLFLAGALVWEVSEFVVILLFAVLVTSVLTNPTDPNEVDPHQDAEARLVVFGDSYISGEGAEFFFVDTNVAGFRSTPSETDNECRRSSTAYPYLVADALGYGLDFYACSGAKSYDIVAGTAGALSSPITPQLDAFVEAEQTARAGDGDYRDIAAVLVSVGGNDAWFGTVGQACLGPGTCDIHRNTLLRTATEIGSRIGLVYTRIKEVVAKEAGQDVPVVAMPYPLILTDSGCEGSPLTLQEHQFLFEFTEVLNDTARVEATRAGVHWFSDGIVAFEGSRICDDGELAVNVLDVQPKNGNLWNRLSPVNWFHGSAHPNAHGHELTAAALEPWLRSLLDEVEKDPNQTANPDPVSVVRGIFPPSISRVSVRSLALDPSEIGCPSDRLRAVTVQVEPEVLGNTIPLTNVAPESVACYSDFNGGWSTVTQTAEDGTLDVPAWDREVALDFDPNRDRNRQIILWESTSGDWRIRVGGYCELDPSCASSEADIRSWMVGGIEETAKGGVIPIALMLTGTWFLAVEIKRWSLSN